jgi:hypothetical protein
MRPYPRILTGLAGLLAMLALTGEASAFCRSTTCKGTDCPRDDAGCKTTGQKLYWPSACVGFSVQHDGTQLIAMKYIEQTVRKSFASWSDLPCDTGTATMTFSELPQVTCRKSEYNPTGQNANIIYFEDNKWNYTSEDNTLAKTTVTFDDATGQILDADIAVNHAYNDITVSDQVVQYDLESILTHEVGHFIGLDHSDDPSATMFAAYDPGTIDLRSLEADDVAAACAAYPPERVAKCVTTPHGGLGDECRVDQAGAGGCAVPPGPSGSGEAPRFAVVFGAVLAIMRDRHRRRERRKLGQPEGAG